MSYTPITPDPDLKKLFKKALPEFREIAEKHGFSITLIDSINGTWYFYPQVSADWKPEYIPSYEI